MPKDTVGRSCDFKVTITEIDDGTSRSTFRTLTVQE